MCILADQVLINLSPIDWLILAIYLLFVLGIGFYLKRFAKSSEDFFLAGRKNSCWVAGVAFMSANMGAMEVIGYMGTTMQYGIHAAQFYLVGAIPAMIVLGLVMMRFYYSSRIKSIPGYLHARFDEKTRIFNAVIFAIMMVLVSGISLYLLAMVMELFLGWPWDASVWLAAAFVCLYVSMAGLISAIFTEVLQFFLIWAGILILPVLGAIHAGGIGEMWSQLGQLGPGYTHLWASTASPHDNPMQYTWMSMIFGMGVVAFGYWTTDFLIIQRAFSAKDLRSAQLAPIIGSFFKMLLGVVVVGGGIVALTMAHDPASHFHLIMKGTGHVAKLTAAGMFPAGANYDSALPLMMAYYFPRGMIGLGITAIVAMLMAGQAGNMSAFTAVWTYDLYQPVIRPNATEKELVRVGRIATIGGILLAVAGAYAARAMPSAVDYLQAIASMILAPAFAIILPGMFFKRLTPNGAFWGLLLGCASAFTMFLIVKLAPVHEDIFSPIAGGGSMSANFWRGCWAFVISLGIAAVVSLFTKPRSDEELKGLVWGLTDIVAQKKVVWYRSPMFWGMVSLAVFTAFNLLLW